ncbi:hypothetical protein ACP2AV_03695 [Aliiroseovarius sp. PTFE2010]
MDEEDDEVFSRARDVVDESEIQGYGTQFTTKKENELRLIEKKKEDHLAD